MFEPFDKEIVIDLFRQIVEHLEMTQKSFEVVPTVAFFQATHTGKEKLASICMFLMVVGELVKKIDKLTHGAVLMRYTYIDWRRIISFRNIVAHDYGHVDSEIVFNICTDEIEPLLNTVNRIINDLEKNHVNP
ncbi:MAG: DUF86 domain-containing protein [Planctomycetaceae bacterium]|jgi:uncharacterized protein with HEPN domain|nr:DUF86 domain-containing protein [Planctomycetaceae bacterium]